MATEINRKETYIYQGKEYDHLKDIRTDLENQLGYIIDQCVVLSTKDKLKTLEVLIANRDKLIPLLSVVFDVDPDSLQGDLKNIFDIV